MPFRLSSSLPKLSWWLFDYLKYITLLIVSRVGLFEDINTINSSLHYSVLRILLLHCFERCDCHFEHSQVWLVGRQVL